MNDLTNALGVKLDNSFIPNDLPCKYDFTTSEADIECQDYEKFFDSSLGKIKYESTNFTKYSSFNGLLELRELISNKKFDGVITPDKIWLTNGASGAFLLLCDIFLQPYDTVLVESYCYSGFLGELLRRKINIIHIDSDDKGLSADSIDKNITELRRKNIHPKFIYIMPNFQNPTTKSIPLDRRLELVEITEKHRITVIENDCYSDFSFNEHPPIPSLYELSKYNNVIYISSFSKLLGCSIRVGYLIAEDVFKPAIDQSIYGRTPCKLSTICVYSYLEKYYEQVMTITSNVLKKKRDIMIDAINSFFPKNTSFEVPRGGMIIWVELPKLIDIKKLVSLSEDKNVRFLPANKFNLSKLCTNHIRLSFSNKNTIIIRDGIKILGNIIKDL